MQIPYQPFYMQYPMYDIFDDYNNQMKDYEYLRQFYPKDIGKVQDLVEEECDKLEYDGSVMYDEYPDRIGMLSICSNIKGMMPKHEEKSWLEKVIEVLLYQEFRRRRERRRRYR